MPAGVAVPTGGLFQVPSPLHVCSGSPQPWAQGRGWPAVTQEGSRAGKVQPGSGPFSLWLNQSCAFFSGKRQPRVLWNG